MRNKNLKYKTTMNINETIETKVIISEAILKEIPLIIESMKESTGKNGFKRNHIPSLGSLKEKKGIECECSLTYSYRKEEKGLNRFGVQIIPPEVDEHLRWKYEASNIPQEVFFSIKNEVGRKFSPPIEMWLNSLEQ